MTQPQDSPATPPTITLEPEPEPPVDKAPPPQESTPVEIQPAPPVLVPHEKKTSTDVLLTVGIFIAVIIVGGLLLMWFRRRMLAQDAAAQSTGLLDDLRRMRDSGQISTEEYDAIRKKMAARMKAGFDAPRPDNRPS